MSFTFLCLRQQLFKSLPVKANDDLAINDNNRSRHRTKSFELFDCQGILSYVLFFKNKAPLRKELFRFAAEKSAGLAINNYFLDG